MDASDISVYGEAKGEYTRQLCVFLVPCLESYFLELLEEAKVASPNPNKVLWHFQTLMQSIPDWNQDKVIRETDRIQKECKCDYLEELLTAVFIAHTKVLSAIRLTTKQKKLQITIPKIDHFIHRVLSDSARSLWTNAFLFAETNSIDKQKNLRQVSALLQESVLQGIRGLLPVKSILREYLYDSDHGNAEEDDGALSMTDGGEKEAEVEEDEEKEKEAAVEEKGAEVEEKAAAVEEKAAAVEEKAAAVEEKDSEGKAVEEKAAAVEEKEAAVEEGEAVEEGKPVEESQGEKINAPSPMIYIDTKPSVTFSNEHVMFDSDNLENNEIQDIPFAEAENRYDDDGDVIDSVLIMDEVLPMDSDEIIG